MKKKINLNWQIKKLGEVCKVFTDGNWIESKDQSTDGIRLIQTGNIGQGYFKDREEKARYISEKTFKRLNCREIFENDVLVSRLPDPVGRACIIPNTGEKMITAVDCSILRFNNNIISSFFNYFSQSNNYLTNVEALTSGTTRKRISRNNLGLIEIPIPPISEQHRIVKKLNEVFGEIEKAKENTEKNLKNSKELFESYLQNIFDNSENDWRNKKLYEVAQIEKIKNSKKGLPYVGMEDIESNSTRFLGSLEARNVKSSSFYFSSDHILYGRLRPYLNKILLPNFEGHCSTEIFPIKVKEDINKHFLMYWFFRNKTVQKINKTCTGTRMPRANMNKVFEFLISYPSIFEQKSIVKKLDELSEKTKRLKEIYRQKLADLEELKKSILKQAFEGKL